VEGAGGAEVSVAREFAPPRKGKQNNPKQGAGKRAREDYAGGAQRAGKKSRAVEAGVQEGGEAEAADGQKREAGGQKEKAGGKAEKGKKAASSKKGGAGALLEDKGAQLAMIDHIGASKEGKISAKLSQEKDKWPPARPTALRPRAAGSPGASRVGQAGARLPRGGRCVRVGVAGRR
jgi:hypothetical protein